MAPEFDRMDGASAEEVLRWCAEKFGHRAALATSYGVEDMVLMHIIKTVAPSISIFTLDTGRLPEETYRLMERAREHYALPVKVYFPNTRKVEEMVSTHGLNLFYQSVEMRKLCCHLRKVEPLHRALDGVDAWITGLRREQTTTRGQVKKVEVDKDHGGILKISPLADWTFGMVWEYVRKNHVPYNELHDKGYPSIGCAPCTRAVKPEEDPRAGRWWWERGEKECGLHTVAKPA